MPICAYTNMLISLYGSPIGIMLFGNATRLVRLACSVVGARVRARFVSGKGARVGARCARRPGCAVRASLVRASLVRVGALVRGVALRWVCHARTLARVPALLARVPACQAPQRFCSARRWRAVRASLVRAPCRARRCASFLRVVGSLWLTVRRCA